MFVRPSTSCLVQQSCAATGTATCAVAYLHVLLIQMLAAASHVPMGAMCGKACFAAGPALCWYLFTHKLVQVAGGQVAGWWAGVQGTQRMGTGQAAVMTPTSAHWLWQGA